jgi:hypothetical protein
MSWCPVLEIAPNRAVGTTCKYCKHIKVDWGRSQKPKVKKEPEKPVEPLTDLDILDLIGETGLEI